MAIVRSHDEYSLARSGPLTDYFFIHGRVLARRPFPAEVLAHAVLDQTDPLIFVMKRSDGVIDGIEQRLGVVSAELESGARVKVGIPFLYGVVEPAGCAHKRHRAVFHRIDLVQAARFESAR